MEGAREAEQGSAHIEVPPAPVAAPAALLAAGLCGCDCDCDCDCDCVECPLLCSCRRDGDVTLSSPTTPRLVVMGSSGRSSTSAATSSIATDPKPLLAPSPVHDGTSEGADWSWRPAGVSCGATVAGLRYLLMFERMPRGPVLPTAEPLAGVPECAAAGGCSAATAPPPTLLAPLFTFRARYACRPIVLPTACFPLTCLPLPEGPAAAGCVLAAAAAAAADACGSRLWRRRVPGLRSTAGGKNTVCPSVRAENPAGWPAWCGGTGPCASPAWACGAASRPPARGPNG